MKLTYVTVAVFCAIATSASAVTPRTSIAANSCERLKSIISANGQALLLTERGRYRKFVSKKRYCGHFKQMIWHIAPAKDGKCYLKTCREYLRPLRP